MALKISKESKLTGVQWKRDYTRYTTTMHPQFSSDNYFHAARSFFEGIHEYAKEFGAEREITFTNEK